MGLFDFLKKGKKENIVSKPKKPEFASDISRKDMQVIPLEDGRFQIEFYDPSSKYAKLYDTTRLIVDSHGHTMGDSTVHDCMISWYNQDDAIMEGCECSRTMYEKIVATLDIDKMLMMDEEYTTFAMRQLLNQARVRDYLNRGRTDKYPCGNYIGGVSIKEDGTFEKRFEGNVGRECHNSPYMRKVREEAREEQEKAAKRAEIQARIDAAQAELDNLK